MNILKNFKKKNYYSKPFPFFIIDNALSEKDYNFLKSDYKLISNHLRLNKDYNKNNIRLQISSEDFLNNDYLKHTSWHDFIIFHNSKEFVLNLLNIFHDDILKIYPNLENIINKTDSEFFTSMRTSKNLNKYEFVSDVQPGINTPVYKKSSVRGPHVDSPYELIGGLFYLRDQLDFSKGGDLVVHDAGENKVFFEGKAEVQNKKILKNIHTIPYSSNQCIFFLNSKRSIHSINERSITKYERNLTNFIIKRHIDNKPFFKLERKIAEKLKIITKNFVNKFFK